VRAVHADDPGAEWVPPATAAGAFAELVPLAPPRMSRSVAVE
jgi:hypothetical protein